MNDLMNREESPLANFMAAVGLVVMICLLAWLAVQFVRLMPGAFSRLASVFDENQRALVERTGNENVVVVNENDEEVGEDSSADESEIESVSTSSEENVVTPVVTDTKPTTSTPKPAPITYKTVTTYKQPVSDPNGYVDLFASFVAVGTMTANDRFIAASYIEEDEPAAFQFKVKNNGTKTSGEWRFKIELPNGSKIESEAQRPLGPSETSTLTIAFSGVENKKNRDISIEVTTSGDVNTSNNSFKVRVEVK